MSLRVFVESISSMPAFENVSVVEVLRCEQRVGERLGERVDGHHCRHQRRKYPVLPHILGKQPDVQLDVIDVS